MYPPLTPYILDGSTPRVNARLFLQLVPPGLVSVQELKEIGLLHDEPIRWEPYLHRVGFLYFISNDGRKKLLRAVHLRSYSFFLAFFDPDATESEINKFIEVFKLQSKYVKHFSPDSSSVELVCDATHKMLQK